MNNGFEKAEDELVEQVNNGEITDAEFHREMRYLREEAQAIAEEAAQQAYDDAMSQF